MTPELPERASQWAARAELAERAVESRHLRRLWALPGTLLGVSSWPASPAQRAFGSWNYWWQAHVLDCLVDAYVRSPDPRRRARVAHFVNGIRSRNGKDWLNDYYDDMAWLALALQRAEQYVGVRRPGVVEQFAGAIGTAGPTTPAAGSGGGCATSTTRISRTCRPTARPRSSSPGCMTNAATRRPAGSRRTSSTRRPASSGTACMWARTARSGRSRRSRTRTARACYLGACLELASWGNDGQSAAWAERPHARSRPSPRI